MPPEVPSPAPPSSAASEESNAAAADQVILVDERDQPVGLEAKLRAHQNGGKLHRAFSVFVFNAAGQMLLQRRSVRKYHFGGLWTNTCCSHPRLGQSVSEAARNRLREEFGFDADLAEAFSFTYRAADRVSGLTEHEFDHVLLGRFEGQPSPNPDEIDDWKWVHPAELTADLQRHPERYTPWFKIALERVLRHRGSGAAGCADSPASAPIPGQSTGPAAPAPADGAGLG